jgi:hypothetical protein
MMTAVGVGMQHFSKLYVKMQLIWFRGNCRLGESPNTCWECGKNLNLGMCVCGAGYEDAESLRSHRVTGDTEALLD